MTLFICRETQKALREKTYDFIQIRKDDDEAKIKRDVVIYFVYLRKTSETSRRKLLDIFSDFFRAANINELMLFAGC